MTPEIILGLIARYGIPGAKAIVGIVKTWGDKKELTDDDWKPLLEINARPLEFYEKP